MKLLHELSIWRGDKEKKIQLYCGDLTELDDDQCVDLLVVSAFPNDYTPTPGSLIGALHDKGVSVSKLASDKAEDMRAELGCWISKQLKEDDQEALNIKRILCFEPYTLGNSASEVVGNIFRCINNFIFDEALNHIALPIVAAGKQKFPLKQMFEALLDAAIFWLEKGLPVETIKLVHKNEESVKELQKAFEKVTDSRKIFIDIKPVAYNDINISFDDYYSANADVQGGGGYVGRTFSTSDDAIPNIPSQPSVAPINPPGDFSSTSTYDVFVSYSHKQKRAADSFVQELRSKKPGLKVFYDDHSIPKGSQWLKLISDAIDDSRKVVIFISPEYTASKICWDEFQCAKLREYNSDVEVLITIYLKSHNKLPSIFQLNNWIDCREDDDLKVRKACDEVLKVIG